MRIAGAEIPENKQLEVALAYVFGIGRSMSKTILDELNIPYNKKIKDLDEQEVTVLRKKIESYRIEGDLRREQASNIKRLKEIKCYRGIRHTKKLPCRGQRTKTNSRTLRGNVRVTMGSGKKKLDKK